MNKKHALRMATALKERGEEIKQAIERCDEARYGVVALKFRHQGQVMDIEILDEPLGTDVRIFPGD